MPQEGQPAVAYAAKTLGALARANRRLINDRAFYEQLRIDTQEPPTDAPQD
jgi:hypothetical protein